MATGNTTRAMVAAVIAVALVVMRDRRLASAVLDASLLGQAVGSGITDVLFGRVNPSGKLTETIPKRLQDVPAWGNFPGDELHVRYGEGIYVGYRSYDHRGLEVTFPFGHGLSYTEFRYSDLEVSGGDELTATFRVENVGRVAGREVVQLYTSIVESTVSRAPRALAAFATMDLEAGESRRITLRVRRDDLAYWSVAADAWVVEGGEYSAEIGASSRDIRLSSAATVRGDDRPRMLGEDSTVAEVLADPVAGPVLGGIVGGMFAAMEASDAARSGFDVRRMIGSTPMRRFISSLGGVISRTEYAELVERANDARSQQR